MNYNTDLDAIAADIRSAAEACDAKIVNAIVTPDGVPTARIDAADFPNLIAHLRPRLVYLSITPLNVDDETEEILENSLAETKKFISRWKTREGQTCRLIVGVMADGILHCIVHQADWFDDFEAEAEALAAVQHEAMSAQLQRAQEAEAKRAEAEEKKRLLPYIEKLMADPRFFASRISALKRATLAEALFPDLDRTTIRKIVERATNEHWLAGSAS